MPLKFPVHVHDNILTSPYLLNLPLDESSLGPRYTRLYLEHSCDEESSDSCYCLEEKVDSRTGLYDISHVRENWRVDNPPRTFEEGTYLSIRTRHPLHKNGVWFRVEDGTILVDAMTESAAHIMPPEVRRQVIGQSCELWEAKNHPTSSMGVNFVPHIQELYVADEGTIEVRQMQAVRVISHGLQADAGGRWKE